jgi:hypothetical protein
MIGSVSRKSFAIFSWIGVMAVLPETGRAQSASPYPGMAPIEQYRMTPDAEIALAKSAAPASVSGDAEILVMGAAGYETAEPGKNGFVCLVGRSWANDFGSPDFWNPKARSPVCFNAAAARSVLPDYLNRTRLALGGATLGNIKAASTPTAPEVGAMAYMMSKHGYLNGDVKGPWHPHLMFFFPHTPDSGQWGANVEHSPVTINDAATAALTTVDVRVAYWSDGTPDSTSVN